MKSSLILSLIMVSVTAMASDDAITLLCGSQGNLGETVQTNVFSGQVKVIAQADEVIFADSMLSAKKGGDDSQFELLTLENMHGIQQRIKEESAENNFITSMALSSDEESESKKAYLVVNLGEDGSNARLTVNDVEIYSARCEITNMNYNPYEDLIQKLTK